MSNAFLKSIGLTHPNAKAAAPAPAPPPASSGAAAWMAIGASAEGPEFDQLYAFTTADGSRPLDHGVSKAGASLNDHAVNLAATFGQVKAVENAWQADLDAVKQKAAASVQELAKMVAAKEAFSSRTDKHDDVRQSADDYVQKMRAVQKAMREIKPQATHSQAALQHVLVVMQGKEVRSAERAEELAKETLEKRKEEVKEAQERMKGALDVLTKFASVTEWVEIIPDALAFADEQLFAELPKAELAALKKKVDQATEHLHDEQDKLDAAAFDEANTLLDEANERWENSKSDLVDALKAMAASQHQVIVKMASGPTADVAKMIAASKKMKSLMATAAASSRKYLAAAAPVLKECDRVAELYRSYPAVVRETKKTQAIDSGFEKSLGDTARRNEKTLKSWVAYLESFQEEGRDAVKSCTDMSDKGFMKNYNKIEDFMQGLLSA